MVRLLPHQDDDHTTRQFHHRNVAQPGLERLPDPLDAREERPELSEGVLDIIDDDLDVRRLQFGVVLHSIFLNIVDRASYLCSASGFSRLVGAPSWKVRRFWTAPTKKRS
jgi:hypothetical protein